jgi:hypothetical protein
MRTFLLAAALLACLGACAAAPMNTGKCPTGAGGTYCDEYTVGQP